MATTDRNPVPAGRGFEAALEMLEGLVRGIGPTRWIGTAERQLVGIDATGVGPWLETQSVTPETLRAALLIKSVAGQINVVVHALGILTALPYILETDEVIESLSLGAGNTGRDHDLTTDRRIAEFKFIEWRGGPESIRQNGLFADLFNLASDPVTKRKQMYVVGKTIPLRFLGNRRSLSSLLSKNVLLTQRFHDAHGDQFGTVRDYYDSIRGQIEIIDLLDVVPGLKAAQ